MKIFNTIKSIKSNILNSRQINGVSSRFGNTNSVFTTRNYRQDVLDDFSKIVKKDSINPFKSSRALETAAIQNKVLINQPSFSGLGLFKTEKLMLEAKDKCVKALNISDPKEVLVFVDKSKKSVLGEFEGAFDGVDVPSSTVSKITRDTVGLHGHPAWTAKGDTAPISFQDFLFLNETKLGEYVAFNKKGEFSSLAKTPEFKELSKSEINSLESEYMKYLIHSLSPEDKKEVSSLINQYHETGSRMYGMKFLQIINKHQLTPEGMKATDSFWKECSSKLGLEYRTDFSKFSGS